MGVKKNCYIFIYKQLKGYRGTVLNILISSILVTFLGMNWPLVYRYIINSVFYNGSLSELKFIFLVYILLFFSEKTLQYIWKLSEAVIASDFVFKLRKMLYQKIFTLNMSDKERYSSGEILDIINNDVQQVYTFLVDEGVFAITCFVRLIMAMIYIYYINKYASFFILFLTIINYLISKYLRDRFMIYFREYKKRLENYIIETC